MSSSSADVSAKLAQIYENLTLCAEWLVVYGQKTQSLTAAEIEFFIKHDALFIEFAARNGWQTFRVERFSELPSEFSTRHEEKPLPRMIFDVSRRFGREKLRVELLPRRPTHSFQEEIKLARQEHALALAASLKETFPDSELEKVDLTRLRGSLNVGKFAKILLRRRNGNLVGACGFVVGQTDVNALFANAILWLEKLSATKKYRKVGELILFAEDSRAAHLVQMQSLLRAEWQSKIRLFSVAKETSTDFQPDETTDENSSRFIWRELETVSIDESLNGATKSIRALPAFETRAKTRQIENLAPDEIDVRRVGKGDNLRFRGMNFARVREVFGRETLYFGTEEGSRRTLDDGSQNEFETFWNDLCENRRFDAPNKRHRFYRNAPEAWLEHLLRKDIRRIDPHLILAPLHAQIRLVEPPNALDLLALRRDGRLVVIELKTSESRDLPFQAADYWRQIEQQRIRGNLAKAALFGDLPILDAPPIVYLVAPFLSFHKDSARLAKCLNRRIEIWEIALAENWRENISVVQRQKLN